MKNKYVLVWTDKYSDENSLEFYRYAKMSTSDITEADLYDEEQAYKIQKEKNNRCVAVKFFDLLLSTNKRIIIKGDIRAIKEEGMNNAKKMG